MSALKKKPAAKPAKSAKLAKAVKVKKVAKAAAKVTKVPVKPAAKPAKKVSKPVAKPAPVRRAAAKPIGLKAKGRSANVVPAAPAVAFQLPLMPAHLVAAVKALDEKKAVDLRVLQLGQLSSVADFLVVATGNSEPHLRALRIELERVVEAAGSKTRTEAHKDSGWSVVDAFDVVFHLFRDDTRRSYGLESLWKDGLDIPVAAILKA
ncbi:ribosomal silencing factor RsfS [Opitutia bacterium]|nr:ribosomal silencing factor RsfS [Opitutae bacterium]